MGDDWHDLVIRSSATELGDLLAQREIGAVELLDAYLVRLEEYDGVLRSHVCIDPSAARRSAELADRELAAGIRRSRLHGVPVSHKDNILTAGMPTRVHSQTSIAGMPRTDATAVARLKEAGMVLLGKTNTTEFACGDQHIHGDTPNPWDVTQYSGASSAGSASAVAASLTAAATGSDTGGSIRAPAAMCGIVGVKPTYGRVSRYGLVPLAWSMDHIGPMTRTVEDAAEMLVMMAGQDPRDLSSISVSLGRDLTELPEGLNGVRIGVPRGHFAAGLSSSVETAYEAALAVLDELGACLEEVALPMAGQLAPVGSLLSMWEGFTLHASHLRTEAQAYGPKARSQLASGGFYGSDEVGLAMQLRWLWARQLTEVFRSVDAIVTPTLPFTSVTREAWVAGAPDTSWATRAFSLSGHPALTLPCGADERGLPIGLQVAARHFHEATMFRVAHNYERSTNWRNRRPDPAAWVEPAAHNGAVATVAALPEGERRALQLGSERLGLQLSDQDLDRVGGIVGRVRKGLTPFRLDRSLEVEPLAFPYVTTTTGYP